MKNPDNSSNLNIWIFSPFESTFDRNSIYQPYSQYGLHNRYENIQPEHLHPDTQGSWFKQGWRVLFR